MRIRYALALALTAAALAAVPAAAPAAELDLGLGLPELQTPQLAQGDVSQADLRAAIAEAAARGAKPRKLRRPRPDWFTAKQERKLKRDRDGVRTAPVDAPLPGEVGIRPGAWMISPYFCTMNYLFQKGGVLAIGTAGHCIDPGEPVVLLTLAPGSSNPVLVELGKVLLKRNAGIGKDYALVEVPPHLHEWSFPTIGVIGGPCGVYADGEPTAVAHYGHGLVGGTGGTPRAGMGFELEDDPGLVKGVDWDWDADSIVWAGYLYGGDSGSPVRVGALGAVADLTHGIGITGLEPSAIGWGTRVTTITSSGWQLINSPLCP